MENSNPKTESIPLLFVATEEDKVLFKEILVAVYTGNPSVLDKLLEKENAVAALQLQQDPEMYSALHYTTFSSPCDGRKVRKPMAQSLLTKYPDLISRKDSYGNTPLHHATEYKKFDLIYVFMKKGPHLLRDERNDGLTPLHLITDRKWDLCRYTLINMINTLTKLPFDTNWTELKLKNLICDVLLHAAKSGGESILRYYIYEGRVDLADCYERIDQSDKYTIPQRCVLAGNNVYSSDFLGSIIEMVGNQMHVDSGNTLIHLAARIGNVQALECIARIATQGNATEEFDTINKNGDNAFHCAIQRMDDKSISCLKALLSIWNSKKISKDQYEDFTAKDKNGEGKTIIEYLCENKAHKIIAYIATIKFHGFPYPWFNREMLSLIYASCPTALLSIMDSHIQIAPLENNSCTFEVKLNFSSLVGSNFEELAMDDSSALHWIFDCDINDRHQILRHPLVKCYLRRKWKTFKWVGMSWLILQVALVLAYNFLAVSLYGYPITNSTDDSDTNTTATSTKNNYIEEDWLIRTASAIVTFLTILCFLKELAQMCSYSGHLESLCKSMKKYWKSPLNWFQLGFNLIAFIVVYDGFIIQKTDGFDWHVGLAAFGSFFSIFLLIRDLGRLPRCEKLFEVLIIVIRSSIKVLVFYLPCLLAFTIAFRILMKNNDDFNLPYGFVKVLSMAIGELDYEKILEAHKDSDGILLGVFVQLMYLVFAFLAAIVLINLLIAFAVSDIQALLQDAETSQLANQLRLINSLEQFLKAFARFFLKDFVQKNFFLAKATESEPIGLLSPELLRQELFELLSPELGQELQQKPKEETQKPLFLDQYTQTTKYRNSVSHPVDFEKQKGQPIPATEIPCSSNSLKNSQLSDKRQRK